MWSFNKSLSETDFFQRFKQILDLSIIVLFKTDDIVWLATREQNTNV